MQCKEHVIHYLVQGKIRLSEFDQKFLTNLQAIIHTQQRVTSNQVALVDTLISKYKRQLMKNEVDANMLLLLPWRTTVVPSAKEYTGAKVTLKNDVIHIRTPFNKRFITKFKEIKDNPFIFDKALKVYTACFTTTAFKIAATHLKDYFDPVSFCDTLDIILNKLEELKRDRIWDPTLISVNGNLILAAVNPIIGNLLNDIELKKDAETFYRLSLYGIKIAEELQDTPELKFAASFSPEMDIDNIEQLAEWINNIGCTSVVYAVGLHKVIREDLTNLFKKNNIQVLHSAATSDSVQGEQRNKLILFKKNHQYTMLDKNFGKAVVIKNSRPINIK